MKKITNKHCVLSTIYLQEYAAWEEGTLNDKSFEKYDSSNFRHYCSIKMELLRCQKGLCAYTEKNLCPPELYDEAQWENGVYVGDCKKLKAAKGQLDHFDSSLKKIPQNANPNIQLNRPRPWDWGNFLVVDSDANTKKLQKDVNIRFKPDNPNYDPLDWLDYDIKTHHFVPKEELTDSDKNEVLKMLDALGILAVWNDRRRYLTGKILDIKKGLKSIEEVQSEIDEFPTAFAFCLRKLNL